MNKPGRGLLRATAGLGCCLVAVLLIPPGNGQAPPTTQPEPKGEMLPAPRPAIGPGVAPAEGPVSHGYPAPVVPINLPTALRLAQTTNLDIAQAREVVNRAGAQLDQARVAILPNFNLGSQYFHHEGAIQKTEGNIITANKDSLFVGGGPSVNFQTADALFVPLVAQQLAVASEAGLQRVNSDTLLAVANAYFNVLLARRRLAAVEETIDFLLSERGNPLRGGSKGLLPLMRAVVEEGGESARRADLARVQVEVSRRDEDWVAARQDLQLAAAELARLIRLDPTTPLWPVEDFRVPLALPGDVWSDQPVDELMQQAVASRPELAESRALLQAALAQLREAQYRPLLPIVVMNYNFGGFGGGPDLNPPVNGKAVPGFGPSGRILRFDTRTDFDVSLVWRLQNLGFGNRAEVLDRTAAHRQAILRQLQVLDQVVTQVVQAQEAVLAWRQRVNVTRRALFDAKGAPNGPVFQSILLTFERIRATPLRGTPGARVLELLDSIRSLSDSLAAYGLAVTEYERARFRLLIALGLPPQSILDPEAMPLPHPPSEAGTCANPPGRETVTMPSDPSPLPR